MATSTNMGIDNSTPYGAISITLDAIAQVAGSAALEVYGVAGLATKNEFSNRANEVLTKSEDYGLAINCEKSSKSKGYIIGIYIYVAPGVKITEVANEVQRRIRYVLEKTFSVPFSTVNVYVKDVKEMEAE